MQTKSTLASVRPFHFIPFPPLWLDLEKGQGYNIRKKERLLAFEWLGPARLLETEWTSARARRRRNGKFVRNVPHAALSRFTKLVFERMEESGWERRGSRWCAKMNGFLCVGTLPSGSKGLFSGTSFSFGSGLKFFHFYVLPLLFEKTLSLNQFHHVRNIPIWPSLQSLGRFPRPRFVEKGLYGSQIRGSFRLRLDLHSSNLFLSDKHGFLSKVKWNTKSEAVPFLSCTLGKYKFSRRRFSDKDFSPSHSFPFVVGKCKCTHP